MNIPTIDIDAEGNIKTIYKDDLLLQDIGHICNVRRASWIDFDHIAQEWVVRSAGSNKDVFRNKSRDKCVEWEIENFSPGGTYCHC